MTVKALFLLLVMWMPLAIPCHAGWYDSDDDWYYIWDEDDCIFGGVLPDVIVDGTDRSNDDDGSYGDSNDWYYDDDSDDDVGGLSNNNGNDGSENNGFGDNSGEWPDCDSEDNWNEWIDSESTNNDSGEWFGNYGGASGDGNDGGLENCEEDNWPDNANCYEDEDPENRLFDNVEDFHVTKNFSTEELISFAKLFSNRVCEIITQFEEAGRIKVMETLSVSSTKSIPVNNPKYDPSSKCIILPLKCDFTTPGLVHELIHAAQDEKNMFRTECMSDNEYQTYVINFILQRAIGDDTGAPKGVGATTEWDTLNELLKRGNNNCGIENGVVWINQSVLVWLENVDHQSLSELFRDYYETYSPHLDVYWKYHDPNYEWNWKILLDHFGVTIKK